MTPEKQMIKKIMRGSPSYPARLDDLYDPPSCIYTLGNIQLLQRPMIAIVGSRAATLQGLNHSYLFAQWLSNSGALIISGLARGIDGAAHRGSLASASQTVAVCGTGLDITYPKEHCELAQQIARQGLLVSEFPPGTAPRPFHFPRRNRIIAALALGVVVIEATKNSGSLITARLAADLGREVFALPGNIDDGLSAGCHQLIQQGAKLVCNPKEVLEEVLFP
jgi:DNA processing protein